MSVTSSDFTFQDTQSLGEPLRKSIYQAVGEYLSQFDGEESIGNVYQMVINEVERSLLQTTLIFSNGTLTKAAAVLGISRHTLRKKIKYHQLDGCTQAEILELIED